MCAHFLEMPYIISTGSLTPLLFLKICGTTHPYRSHADYPQQSLFFYMLQDFILDKVEDDCIVADICRGYKIWALKSGQTSPGSADLIICGILCPQWSWNRCMVDGPLWVQDMKVLF